MAETTKAQVEDKNAETETEADEDEGGDGRMSFAKRVDIFIDSLEEVAPAKDEHSWPTYRFVEGINKETLAQKMGYKNTNSATQGLTAIRKYLQYGSMMVNYKGEQYRGEDLMKKLGLSRTNFVSWCDAQLDSANRDSVIEVTEPGFEFPEFSTTRSRGETPKIDNVLSRLKGLSK